MLRVQINRFVHLPLFGQFDCYALVKKLITSGKIYLYHLIVQFAALVIVIFFISSKNSVIDNSKLTVVERSSSKDVSVCTPKSHIVYLKLHKCASTTIQNIFLRYGYKHNLTFAMSVRGNYLGHPKKFKTSHLSKYLHPEDCVVDLFCLHTRLNYEEIKKVVPPDTIWVTSIRDPVYQFESMFKFFGLKKLYKMELEDFGSYRVEELIAIKQRRHGKFGKNQMLFDLGCDNDTSVLKLLKKIEEIDEIFDLVLISEKLEESLILLRHKLCWSLEDVAFLAKNVRKTEAKIQMSSHTIQRIRELNSADRFLYKYFIMKHDKLVNEFGKDKMEREVLALKSLNSRLYDNCIEEEVNGRDKRLIHKEFSKLSKGYLLKNDTDEICNLLTIPELQFLKIIRERQKSRFR